MRIRGYQSLAIVTLSLAPVVLTLGATTATDAQRRDLPARRKGTSRPFVSVRTPITAGVRGKVKVYLRNTTKRTILVGLTTGNPTVAIPFPAVEVRPGKIVSDQKDIWTFDPPYGKPIEVKIGGFYYDGDIVKHLNDAILTVLPTKYIKQRQKDGMVIGAVSISSPVPANTTTDGSIDFWDVPARTVYLTHTLNSTVCTSPTSVAATYDHFPFSVPVGSGSGGTSCNIEGGDSSGNELIGSSVGVSPF